jgi:hypothetical protein
VSDWFRSPDRDLARCQHEGCEAVGNYVGKNGLCSAHDPERHRRASLAGVAARSKFLPESTARPNLRTLSSVLDYAEENAQLVATGKLDTRASAEMRGWAACAMAAIELSVLEGLHRLEKALKGRRLP